MAHYKKFNRAACGHMFKHYERAKDENGEYIKFGNQDIDINKTHLNYNLGPIQRNGQGAFVKERCSEVKMQKRADVNVMCSWVVTVPKEIQADETERFFRETYKFLSDRYGKENVVSAYVHMDETTPHIHFAFVPVVEDKKKNILKVSAKEAVTRKDLDMFHQHLSKYMEKIFGRDIGVLNEATKEGNKSIEELKNGTAKKEYEALKQQTEKIKAANEKQVEKLQKGNDDIEILEDKKRGIEDEIMVLETTFKGKQMMAEKLNEIKPTKDLFGNIKNITIEDIENLKKMAVTTSRYRTALNRANQEIERLRKDNGELKSKVPALKSRMAQAEKEKTLTEENKGLRERTERIDEYISRMPESMWAEFKKIIDEVKEERRQSHAREKDDRGYEIGD